MHIDDLLNRLEGVRKAGANHWMARCPAHKDKSASLSVNCGDDGRLLVYDFAGCTVHAVLAAVGLEVGDLFEQRMRPRTRAERTAALEGFRRHGWEAALRTLAREAMVIQAAAAMLKRGEPLSDDDARRLATAADRIERARGLLAPRGDAARDLRRLERK